MLLPPPRLSEYRKVVNSPLQVKKLFTPWRAIRSIISVAGVAPTAISSWEDGEKVLLLGKVMGVWEAVESF